MRILVTGITGYVGGALVPRLQRDGHELRGLARDPSRNPFADVPVVRGDAVAGTGLDEALEGIDVVFFLIHSMEGSGPGFQALEERAARNVAAAARRAGVRRAVYLGGLVPGHAPVSVHLASRLAVEAVLLGELPDSVALRASIVVGGGSRSFRFLVSLVSRLPVLPLPPWSAFRTQPVDGRDVVELLARAATDPAAGGLSLDAVGPDVVSYAELIDRIAEHMLVGRVRLRLGVAAHAVAAPVAAAIAGEDPGLVGPLMGSLSSDLLPRPGADAAAALGVRARPLDRAVERALRELEEREPGSVAAR